MDIFVTASIGGKAHDLQFVSANVYQSLFSPCEIRLVLAFDQNKCDSIFDKAVNNWIGEKLELIVSDKMDNSITKKYNGTIYNLYLEIDKLIIKARSEDRSLALTEKHKSFADKSVHNVVSSILSSYSLKSSINAPTSSIQFRFLLQYDETDYSFIKRLARYDGCVFYSDGETFTYEPKLRGTSNIKLGLENISDIRLNCFMGDTKFHGVPYDYLKHSDSSSLAVDSEKISGPPHPFGKKIYSKSAELFKGSTEIFNEPIVEKNEFENFIKHHQAYYSGSHVLVSGTTNHPMVVIGRSIESPQHPILKEKFVITKLEASFEGNVYSAKFEGAVKGTIVRDLKTDEREYMGLLQPAIVIDNKDSEKLGRVQIKYLWDIDGNAHAWARVLTSFAGSDHGTHFTPRINDQVLVACEHGNSSLPIVIGALYHSEHKPEFTTDNGVEEVLITRTPSGSEIRVVDKQGSEQILITMPNGENILRMEHKGPKIFIESINGTVKVHSKTIQINADDKIEMNAQEIKINAGNKLVLESGAQAELNASASVKVSSAQVESAASATNVIKGSLVQIN